MIELNVENKCGVIGPFEVLLQTSKLICFGCRIIQSVEQQFFDRENQLNNWEWLRSRVCVTHFKAIGSCLIYVGLTFKKFFFMVFLMPGRKLLFQTFNQPWKFFSQCRPHLTFSFILSKIEEKNLTNISARGKCGLTQVISGCQWYHNNMFFYI